MKHRGQAHSQAKKEDREIVENDHEGAKIQRLAYSSGLYFNSCFGSVV
jgi:hypothetical protein